MTTDHETEIDEQGVELSGECPVCLSQVTELDGETGECAYCTLGRSDDSEGDADWPIIRYLARCLNALERRIAPSSLLPPDRDGVRIADHLLEALEALERARTAAMGLPSDRRALLVGDLIEARMYASRAFIRAQEVESDAAAAPDHD